MAEGEQLAKAVGEIEVVADLTKANQQLDTLAKKASESGEKVDKATKRMEKGIEDVNKASARLSVASANFTKFQQSLNKLTPGSTGSSTDLDRKIAQTKAAINSQIAEEKRFTKALELEYTKRDKFVNASTWQKSMNAAIQGSNARVRPNAAQLFGNVNRAIWQSNATYLGSLNPPSPPMPPGGGRGVFGQGGFLGPGGLGSRVAGGLRGGLGAGLGVYAAVQGGRAVVEATQLATAYDRQEVAARRLAGSQEQLNKLLDAYTKASGGAVNQATSLENVTRLQATGFADTTQELERFVKGTRGAAIALGKPQDYIIQETQLAVSNTSQKRLDQIGLSIEEVTDRIENLRSQNANLTREAAFQEAVIGLLNEKYGTLADTLEGQATGLEKLIKRWDDLNLKIGQTAQGPVNAASEAIGFFFAYLDDWLTTETRKLDTFILLWRNLAKISPWTQGRASGVLTSEEENAAIRMGGMVGGERGYLSNRGTYTGSMYSEEAVDAFESLRQEQLDIETRYAADILQETENYSRQRASIIRNYEKQMVREEEDFQRNRARATRDFEKSVGDLLEDASQRDAEMLEDYNDRISDAREDSAEKLAEMEEEFQEDRERSAKEHRDRLLSAAGSLDAIAVLEERKRWKREQEDRNEAHKKQVEEQKEALEETLQDAREAYEERLEDAHRADEERLQDMREAREQQLSDEDEDRRIRKERAAEDFADQLTELDNQHVLRLKQIEDQAAKEREQWQTEFEKAANEHDLFIKGLSEKFKAQEELTLDWLDMVRDEMEKDIEEAKKERALGNPLKERYEDFVEGFARGGSVSRSGLARVHAGEFVLSRDMLAGRVPVPASVSSSINSSSRMINIAAGAINIQTTPGMELLVGDLVEERFIEILERVS